MITKDQVLDQSLEQILAGSKDSEEDCKIIEKLVQIVVFSNFPERREYVKKVLSKYLRTPIGIETITEDGILYTYINFNNIPKYVLVGRYKNNPVFEIMPTED